MFSSTAEYALRAVVYLGARPSRLWSSQEIAAATKSPPGYISKVLKDLVGAGIVVSRRGPSGGFALARDARRISVLDVVNATDPIERIRTCPLGIPSHGTTLCPLHRRLDSAIALVEKTLADSTIAEMVEPARPGPECAFPTVEGKRPKRVGRHPAAAPATARGASRHP